MSDMAELNGADVFRRLAVPDTPLVPELDGDETTALRLLRRLMVDRGALLAFVGRALEAPAASGMPSGSAERVGAVEAARALAMLHAAEPATHPAHHGAGWGPSAKRLGHSHDRPSPLPGACPEPIDGAAGPANDDHPVDQHLVQAALDVLPRVFGNAWSGDGRRGAAIRRLAFLRDASGLGIGLDHDWVEGLRHGADALALLRALESPVSRPGPRPGSPSVGRRALAGDRVGSLIRKLLDQDRRDHGPTVGAVPTT